MALFAIDVETERFAAFELATVAAFAIELVAVRVFVVDLPALDVIAIDELIEPASVRYDGVRLDNEREPHDTGGASASVSVPVIVQLCPFPL